MPENVLYKDASAPVDKRVEDLLSRMTLEEKVLQLNQYMVGVNDNVNNIGETIGKIPAELGSVIYIHDDAAMRNALQHYVMENSRLGIPMIFGYDVIHGFRTIFPIPLAQAASWNPEAVRKSCAVAAAECNASGVDWTFSPMVDVARDGRWGRISEGYGEDTYAASVYCAAAVKGYQGDDLSAKGTVAACLKHYVGYGASEAGRDYVPTEISRQTLWDTYLPPFEAGVKAGAATLMSSFNLISGVPATSNRYTLTEVLKEKWGHEGFVVSDWDAVKQLINQGVAPDGKEAAMLAFNAGVEMDMVDDLYRKYLPELIEEGKVSQELLDESVRRVLRVKFMLGLFENPYIDEVPEKDRLLLPEYLRISENVAQESMVLLKNEGGLLPLCPEGGRIAVIGPVAADSSPLMGNWSGRGRIEEITSIYDALVKEYGAEAEFVYSRGCDFDGDDESLFAEAVEAASSSDAVVLCLGEKRNWSGENCSRSSIALPQIQENLLKAVRGAAGKPVIVLLSSGRPLDLSRIAPMADAMLEIWQPGTMGGYAAAGILSGRYNPSGKLPVTFPYTTGQIPIYYNRRNSGRRGTQGIYKDITSEPMYEFAYGLSYSKFEYSPVTVSADTLYFQAQASVADSGQETAYAECGYGKVTAEVTVTNVSDVDGMETVHWFICDPYSSIARPVKELKYFEKSMIKAGESRKFTFEIDTLRDLGFVDGDGNRFVEPGDYYIIVKDQKIKIVLK
ncbi:MAG: glycoside hydrolase family 3 C-terminal domain-containing protein [Bacteroides sp.]|nr:glycoside hydrolase family 3 C-terminal domain-containing protein [Bacteroides sp.]